MKIVSFGSCLSRYTIEALQRALPGVTREGHVYHNRVDTFVDTVVLRSRPFVPREVIDGLRFKPGMERDSLAIINNQMRDAKGTMGRHLTPASAPGFFDGLESADVIFMDNFMDMGAGLYQHQPTGSRLFFNTKAVLGGMKDMQGIGLLDTKIAGVKWASLFEWVRERNRHAPIVFINFPTRHHTNAVVRARCDVMAAAIPRRSDVINVPVVDIAKHELCPGTQSHFIPVVYDRYVDGLLPQLKAASRVLVATPQAEKNAVEMGMEALTEDAINDAPAAAAPKAAPAAKLADHVTGA